MYKPLKILLVEDSEDDALLVVRALIKVGYKPAHERVETAKDLWRALENKAWDVIIVDYMIPGFGGIEALQIITEHGMDIPTILVSGKIGEESLVEAMKAGAHDCIQKDSLARLAPAVKREMADVESRRQRRKAVARIHHLNLVLQAIRNVNQLIVTVKDRQQLIAGICDSLTETRGYQSAWIVLLDDDAKPTQWYESGMGDCFAKILELLSSGKKISVRESGAQRS